MTEPSTLQRNGDVMPTTYSEDHPDREVVESVAATPVEGEPAVKAKVVTAPAKKPTKTSPAAVSTKTKS